MRYQISEIRLNAEEYSRSGDRLHLLEKKLRKRLEKMLSNQREYIPSGRSIRQWVSSLSLEGLSIGKESIDARKKPDVYAVFTLSFACSEKLPLKECSRETLPEESTEVHTPEESREKSTVEDRQEDRIAAGAGRKDRRSVRERPVVVGLGPCGIFAAMTLARSGRRPIVIERGKSVEKRMKDVERFWKEGVLDPESNVQFGEGGAGTFSDGKLTTGTRDGRIGQVLEAFIRAGADSEIRYKQRPHIGTDRLRKILPALREEILKAGGEIRFETRLTGLRTEEGRLTGIYVHGSKGRELIRTECMILAIGHSAEDTFQRLYQEGVHMEAKPFSIGVRVEHLQEKINAAQYGDPALAEIFGPAEYKLNHRCGNGRGVYTFCMCPGGEVVNASSSEGHLLINGMSNSARDGKYANSGLLVDVRVEDFERGGDPLAGIAFQRKYEALAWENARSSRVSPEEGRQGMCVSTYGEFRKKEDDPVRESLPGFAVNGILEAMPHLGKKLRGFDDDDTRMLAVESRSSSPVRIPRNERMQSNIRGLIPAGEGPGHAGGIMSAAVDGIRAAEAVLQLR